MKIDVVTIFPEMVEAGLASGIVARAIARGVLDVAVINLRDYTDDRHRVVDDIAYGGGPGMVLKPEPFFRAVEGIGKTRGRPSAIVLMSPQGRRFDQAEAERLGVKGDHLTILCGRYEGVDERVRDGLVTDELSIGDYVLSGGELPALVVLDAVARFVPGVVGDPDSIEHDSFARGLLDYPHYTRPAGFRDLQVPAVLLSGHHGDIERWRKREAVRRTLERRPDLLGMAALDDEERQILHELIEEREKGARYESH